MLIAVIGDLGSGKTLFLVLIAFSTDKDILSNFWLDLDNYSRIDIVDLIDLGKNKVILLDEAYTWLESRISNYFLNRYLSYILFQSRHRDLDIYLSEQLFSSVDVRFRDMVHIIVKCERVKNKREREYWDFKYSILDVESGGISTYILDYDDAKEYFPYFDTYEIIEPHNKEMLELELLNTNPKKLYNKIREIAEEIKEKIDEITHNSLKMALLKEGYNIKYEGLVYSYLKDLEK